MNAHTSSNDNNKGRGPCPLRHISTLAWHQKQPLPSETRSVRHDFVESALSPFLVQMSLS